MALLWIDGFDHYGTSAGNVSNYTGAYVAPSTAAFFRVTTTGLQDMCFTVQTTTGSHFGPSRVLGVTGTRYGVGAHFYLSTMTSNHSLIVFQNASGTNVGSVCFNGTSKALYVTSTDHTGSALATSGSLPPSDAWFHLEIVYNKSDTGSIEVRVAGVPVITFTGDTNTVAGDIARVNFVRKTNSSAATAIAIDNLYIWDATGSTNNDWIGERNVYTLFPDADDTPQDWTLSSGSDAFDLIDNNPYDTDDYLESTALDDEAVFSLEDLPSTDISIIGVQINAVAEKTGTDLAELEVGLITNAVEDTSPGLPQTQNAFLYSQYISAVNPDTGNPWQPTEIQAATIIIRKAV